MLVVDTLKWRKKIPQYRNSYKIPSKKHWNSQNTRSLIFLAWKRHFNKSDGIKLVLWTQSTVQVTTKNTKHRTESTSQMFHVWCTERLMIQCVTKVWQFSNSRFYCPKSKRIVGNKLTNRVQTRTYQHTSISNKINLRKRQHRYHKHTNTWLHLPLEQALQ